MAVTFKKPNFQPIYGRQSANRVDLLQNMQRDPATTTGYIIGTMLGNDYWGKKRARSAAEAVANTEPGTGSGLGSTDWQQANAILQNLGSSPAPGAAENSALEAYNNSQQGNVLYSPTVTEAPKTPQQEGKTPITLNNAGLFGGLETPADTYNKMANQTTYNPGNTALFTNGIRDLSNVAGNGGQNPAETMPADNTVIGQSTIPVKVSQMAEQQATQPFSASQRMGDAIKYLMNNKGYSYEDAAALMTPYAAEWQQREDQETRNMANNLMQQLGSGNMSDAEYKQGVVQLANLGDYGKTAANVYGRDIVSGQDQWRAQQQAARDNRRYAEQRAMNDRNNALRMILAQQRATQSPSRANGTRQQGSANTKSPLASEEFKYMTNRLNEIGSIPEEERTAEQKQFFGTYAPIRDSIVNQSLGNSFGNYGVGQNAPSRPATNSFNPNNYDQAIQKFQALASSGKYNRGDVESFIRQKYGLQPDDKSNEFVESLINGISW